LDPCPESGINTVIAANADSAENVENDAIADS
jgi:hypothetical protein